MRNLIGLSMFLIFFAGCGELSYKRGASAKDLEAAKASCQTTGSEAAIKKCLEDNGWVVQKLDALGLPDSELFATASVNEDNRNPSNTAFNEPTITKLDNEKEAATKPDSTSIKDSSNTDHVAKDSKVSDQVNSNVVKQKTNPSSSKSPFDKYKINSWWKMGAGRAALENSISSCENKLGIEHQPDKKTQTFTRAFAACMYENGWRGLIER